MVEPSFLFIQLSLTAVRICIMILTFVSPVVAGCNHLCYKNYTQQIDSETENTQETY